MKRYKELIAYTLASYTDKAIVFLTPILVLFVAKDRSIYNEIEYVLSFANIAVIFVDIGIKPYLFYGYRNSTTRTKFLEEFKASYLLLFNLYLLASTFIFILLYHSNLKILVAIIVMHRTLYLSYTWFHLDYFRLKDKAIHIFKITIPINILSLIVFYLFYALIGIQNIIALFIIQILFNFSIFIINRKLFKKNQFVKLFKTIKTAIAFSWPIIVNTILLSLIMNYTKIYGYNRLSPEQMTEISLALRISMLIQLTHAAALSFLSKNIFIDEKNRIDKKSFKIYTAMITIATASSLIIILISHYFFSGHYVKFNYTSITLLLSSVCFCYLAFFGAYFTRENLNKIKLLITLIGVLIYFGPIRFFLPTSSSELATYIIFAYVSMFSITFFFLRYHFRN